MLLSAPRHPVLPTLGTVSLISRTRLSPFCLPFPSLCPSLPLKAEQGICSVPWAGTCPAPAEQHTQTPPTPRLQIISNYMNKQLINNTFWLITLR